MPRTSYPPERRGFGRRESRIYAIARLPGRGPQPCIVQNFSDSGALLVFPGSVEPPARFRLTIEAKGIDVMCEVRRRSGAEVGVLFLGQDAAGTQLLHEQLLADAPAAPQPVSTETVPAPARLLLDNSPVWVARGDDVRRRLAR